MTEDPLHLQEVPEDHHLQGMMMIIVEGVVDMVGVVVLMIVMIEAMVEVVEDLMTATVMTGVSEVEEVVEEVVIGLVVAEEGVVVMVVAGVVASMIGMVTDSVGDRVVSLLDLHLPDFSSDAVHLPWVEDPHLHAEEALHQGGIVVTPLHSDKCITYDCSSSFSEGPNIRG